MGHLLLLASGCAAGPDLLLPDNFHSLLVHKEAYLQQHTLQHFFGVFWQHPWLTLADHSEQYVRHGDRDLDLSDYHRRQDEEGDGIVER